MQRKKGMQGPLLICCRACLALPACGSRPGLPSQNAGRAGADGSSPSGRPGSGRWRRCLVLASLCRPSAEGTAPCQPPGSSAPRRRWGRARESLQPPPSAGRVWLLRFCTFCCCRWGWGWGRWELYLGRKRLRLPGAPRQLWPPVESNLQKDKPQRSLGSLTLAPALYSLIFPHKACHTSARESSVSK